VSLTAVCVDDSQLEISLIQRILTTHGVNVLATSTDGLSGLELIRKYRPDFVVLDIILPMMTGIEIAQAIFDEKIPTMVLIASGSGQKVVREQAKAAGARLFIAKPYDDVETWDNIEPFLGELTPQE